jgi:hypothetical protein
MTNNRDLSLWIYDLPSRGVEVEERHQSIVDAMKNISSPFSWRDIVAPEVPVRANDALSSYYRLRYPSIGVLHSGSYRIRDKRFYYDKAACDDRFSFDFTKEMESADYRSVVHHFFPELIAAIGGYRAVLHFDDYPIRYSELHKEVRKHLLKLDGIDIDGRNNIFTLHPAQFWDAELCQRALGYGRDEVIKRLTGRVPLVQPLMDGVYVVFDDNRDLTFEEFCAYNDRLKPVLGLQ